jgi:hypothetical protein
MTMKLVDDAKSAWRWISMRCMAAALALQGAWEVLPDDLKTGIPPKLVTYVALGRLALGMLGRVVKQGEK